MEISQDTKLHLNWTIYFDADGYTYNSIEEARENCYYPEEVTVVKKQNCYILEYDELSDDLKDLANYIKQIHEDQFDCEVNELIWVVNSRKTDIILVTCWTTLQQDIDAGMFSVVEEVK